MNDAPGGVGSRNSTIRLLVVCLLPGGAAALAVFLDIVDWGLAWSWNSARLSPSFALVRDFHLYYGQDEGPVLNTIYGPVTALAYLPATLVATPAAALLIASSISAFFYFAPAVWVLNCGERQAPWNRAAGFLALVCFVLATDRSYPLAYGAFSVHADGPALGLCGLACVLVYSRRDPRDRLLLALSALSAVLAVWSKQTMILVPAALSLYLWLSEGVAPARRFLAAAGLFGALTLLLFWTVFDGPAMLFNLVRIPGNQALQGGLAMTALSELGKLALPAVVTLVLFSLPRLAPSAPPPPLTWRCRLAGSRWTLFALVAAVNVPMCLLSRLKVGADANSHSITVYPLLIAVFLMLATTAGLPAAAGPATPLARGMLATLLAVLAVLWLPRLRDMPGIMDLLDKNPETIAYQAIRDRPGMVYFPEHPLAHIMAEGRVHHFSYALLDRRLGGFPVADNHFLAHIPKAMDTIVFSTLSLDDTETRREILARLPDFQAPPEELPVDWTVYRRTTGWEGE